MLHRVDCEKVTDDSWKVVLSSVGTIAQEQGLLFDCLIDLCFFELTVTIYESRRLTSRKA